MSASELLLAGACALVLFLLGVLVLVRVKALLTRRGIEREQALQRRWARERERQAIRERERDAARRQRLHMRLVAALDQRARLVRVLDARKRSLQRDDDDVPGE